MRISQVSHVAVGVSDMERALVFWRDFLGLTVAVDHEERWDHAGVHRRAVYLRWGAGIGAAYVVLSVDLHREPIGAPARLNQLGVHHFAFDVDDVDAYAAKAEAMGFPLFSKVYDYDATLSGEPGGGQIRTFILQDPDGTFVQLHQWLALHPRRTAPAAVDGQAGPA
jgi:catechol 2,3-dioxygenase-like lactoylglutathione lyase family enzyme